MSKHLPPALGWPAILAALLAAGCAQVTPDPVEPPQQNATVETVVPPQDKPPAVEETAGNDAEKKARKERERARKRAKMTRDLEVARQKLAKARLAREHAEIDHRIRVGKATIELEIERRKLERFEKHEVPLRIERAELSLRRAQDSVTENEEELVQLEALYKDEEFADHTREIVVERARRRLERSRTDLDFRKRDLADLRQRKIPIETAERAAKLDQKEREIEKLNREGERSGLQNEIGVMSAEADAARIEAELAALDEAEQEDQP